MPVAVGMQVIAATILHPVMGVHHAALVVQDVVVAIEKRCGFNSNESQGTIGRKTFLFLCATRASVVLIKDLFCYTTSSSFAAKASTAMADMLRVKCISSFSLITLPIDASKMRSISRKLG